MPTALTLPPFDPANPSHVEWLAAIILGYSKYGWSTTEGMVAWPVALTRRWEVPVFDLGDPHPSYLTLRTFMEIYGRHSLVMQAEIAKIDKP